MISTTLNVVIVVCSGDMEILMGMSYLNVLMSMHTGTQAGR